MWTDIWQQAGVTGRTTGHLILLSSQQIYILPNDGPLNFVAFSKENVRKIECLPSTKELLLLPSVMSQLETEKKR